MGAAGPFLKQWVPEQIGLYSGNSCINIKLNFITVCIGGDIPARVQLENLPVHTVHVPKRWKISAPGTV